MPLNELCGCSSFSGMYKCIRPLGHFHECFAPDSAGNKHMWAWPHGMNQTAGFTWKCDHSEKKEPIVLPQGTRVAVGSYIPQLWR